MGAERKRPIRRLRHEIKLEGYEGTWIELRTNPPMRVFLDMISGDFSLIYPALAETCLSSNYVDDDGKAIDVTQVAGWREVDVDLTVATIDAIRENVGSPLAQKRKTDSSPSSTGTATE